MIRVLLPCCTKGCLPVCPRPRRSISWLCFWLVFLLSDAFLTGSPLAPPPQQETLDQVVPGALGISYTLNGPLDSLENKELTITFSDDMVPLGGTRNGKDLVTISPTTEGNFTWRGTRTLVFLPSPRFAYSTLYTITVKKGITSLHNKTLPKAITWTFITPLAVPGQYRLKSSEYKYFKKTSDYYKIEDAVEVDESLLLLFQQPVSAARLEKYLSLRRRDSLSAIPPLPSLPVQILQEKSELVRIKPKHPLARGATYRLQIAAGFNGSEGPIGITNPFYIDFSTVPTFSCLLEKWGDGWNAYITPDYRQVELKFSNPLKKPNPGLIKIFKEIPPNLIPLDQFNVERSYDKNRLIISIADELHQGDRLIIHIEPDLTNIYGEKLEKAVRVKVYVSSNRNPGIYYSFGAAPAKLIAGAEKHRYQDRFSSLAFYTEGTGDQVPRDLARAGGEGSEDRLNLVLVSIAQLELDLVRFRCENSLDFLKQLNGATYGLLNRPGFREGYIERVTSHTLRGSDFSRDFSFDLAAETGAAHGFFGVLAKKAIPFNLGRDEVLYQFSRNDFPVLDIYHKRDIDFIARSSPDRHDLWVYHNLSQNPLEGSEIGIFSSNGWTPLGKTGADGRFTFRASLNTGDIIVAKDPHSPDFAFYKVPQRPDRVSQYPRDNIEASLFTDKNFYRPGESVHIAGVIKKMTDERTTPTSFKKVKIALEDSSGEVIREWEVLPDRYGGFYTTLDTTASFPTGEYFPTLYYEKQYINSDYISIGYYQPNTFEITVSGMQKAYRYDEPFKAVVRGEYLAGNPMSGDAFTYRLELKREANSHEILALLKAPQLSAYLFNFAVHDNKERTEEKNTITGKDTLAEGGEKVLEFDWGQFRETRWVRRLDFTVTGESPEGKEISTTKSAFFFPGRRLLGIQPPEDPQVNQDIVFPLVCVDSSGKLASCSAGITIFKTEPEYSNYSARYHTYKGFYENMASPRKIKTFPDLKFNGKDKWVHRFNTAGLYHIRFEARDDKNRKITTYILLYVADKSIKEDVTFFDIYSEKDMYKTGDKASIVFNTNCTGKVLLTVERKQILDSFLLDIHHITRFSLDIKKEYFPGIKIKAVGLVGRAKAKEAEIVLEIEDTARKLEIDIQPTAQELLPSTPSKIRLKVTDHQNRGKKAKLFVYCVDEGELSLSRYLSPDLYNFFYYSNWSWEYNSLLSTFHSFMQNRITVRYPLTDVAVNPPCVFGRIMEKDGTPLPGVRITLKRSTETLQTVFSSRNGYYAINNLEKGEYTVFFEKEGFITVPVYIPLRDRSSPYIPFNFVMNPIKTSLPGIKSAGKVSLNIAKNGSMVRGRCVLAEGTVLAGVKVILSRASALKTATAAPVRTAVSSVDGRFYFPRVKAGTYNLEFQIPGLIMTKQNLLQFRPGIYSVAAVFQFQELHEEVAVNALPGTIDVRRTHVAAAAARTRQKTKEEEFNPPRVTLRSEGNAVLFFKNVETDDNGCALVEFNTSDRLSTYRIMAEAYTEDSFGSTSRQIVVSKQLLLQEAMPEFARSGDHFKAGVMVNNREPKEIKASVMVNPSGLHLEGPKQKNLVLKENSHQPVYFDFKAGEEGEAGIEFYALARRDRDGLVKKLPVTTKHVTETLLDFAVGTKIHKALQPVPGAITQKLKIVVSPSILGPAAKIAKRLTQYPYQCLEQKTSGILPLIVWDDNLLERLEIKMDRESIRQAINSYIALIPEFMAPGGGVAYYRGGDASGYLTAYVLWALTLAQERGFVVDELLLDKMAHYLAEQNASPGSAKFFSQYVLALKNKADKDLLEKGYRDRAQLPLTERIFLYQALYHQLGDKSKSQVMSDEFQKRLRLESDFAYFDAGLEDYNTHLPFYSSRYITALLLQAILEVEGKYLYAPQMIKWLLEFETQHWFTTHDNAWIMLAVYRYNKTVEKELPGQAEITLLGERYSRRFAGNRDTFVLEKEIGPAQGPFEIDVSSNYPVYLNLELQYAIENAPAQDRGIQVRRIVYDKKGNTVTDLHKGQIYQVEILIAARKEVPYGVIAEPIPAGLEILREDIATTEARKEFNTQNETFYDSPWITKEIGLDRLTGYTYSLKEKSRVIYFVKALYTGTFTWLPTVVQGMYHPQYSGRDETREITIKNSLLQK